MLIYELVDRIIMRCPARLQERMSTTVTLAIQMAIRTGRDIEVAAENAVAQCYVEHGLCPESVWVDNRRLDVWDIEDESDWVHFVVSIPYPAAAWWNGAIWIKLQEPWESLTHLPTVEFFDPYCKQFESHPIWVHFLNSRRNYK